jgi:hypothetical protein
MLILDVLTHKRAHNLKHVPCTGASSKIECSRHGLYHSPSFPEPTNRHPQKSPSQSLTHLNYRRPGVVPESDGETASRSVWLAIEVSVPVLLLDCSRVQSTLAQADTHYHIATPFESAVHPLCICPKHSGIHLHPPGLFPLLGRAVT